MRPTPLSSASAVRDFVQEVRHAARSLAGAPGTTTFAVLIMAVGLGASAALFALVDAVLLRPLPYPDPDALVRIFDTNQRTGVDRSGIATGNLHEWRRRARAFSGLAGSYAMGRTLSVDGQGYAVVAAQVTEDFFAVAGVPPALGRTFTTDDTARATYNSAMMPTGADPVAILSHVTWRTRFGGDPQVVGRTVLVERLPYTIVGVMPAEFALPTPEAEMWLPWHVDAKSPRDQHYVGGLARLTRGTTIEAAEGDLVRVAADLGRDYPATNADWSARLVSLHAELVGGAGRVLWLLLGAIALVLLVACGNVALLTMTRALDRAGDTALRLAIGATPSRIVRQVLLEALLQTGCSAVLGVVLAAGAIRMMPSLVPELPRVGELSLSLPVLAFVSAVAALTAVLSALPQAWHSTRVDPAAALAGSSRRTIGTSHSIVRHAMTVSQVALAVVLLTGAGLLVRSVRNLSSADTGFDASGVLVAPVFLDTQGYKNADQVRTYYRTLFGRLAALPGVRAVGGSTTVPTSPLGPDFARPVWRQDAVGGPADHVPASVRIVSSGYAAVMGLRVKAGRAIDDRDLPDGPRVVVVSESLARQMWPAANAVGQSLMVDYSTAGTYPYEVVGVVGDVRFRGPRSAPDREIYLSHAQRPYLIMNVVVKANGDPRLLAADVRRVMREVDPQKPPQSVDALEDLLRETYARDRLTMATLVAFAGAAALLAALSVYGVLSRLVGERTRDIAIRMAMGAEPHALLRWIAGMGARLLLAGIVAGWLATRLGSNTIDGLLYGIAPSDPMTTLAVCASVALLGGLATLLPWRRVTRVDPVEALRRG